jgi:hypothetical protein
MAHDMERAEAVGSFPRQGWTRLSTCNLPDQSLDRGLQDSHSFISCTLLWDYLFISLSTDRRASTLAGAEGGMSLHIYIAHTGEHFLADPVAFASYVLHLP